MLRSLRVIALAVLVSGLTTALQAQSTAVVKRNTNLRPDPSTFEDPIELLTPGIQLTLLKPLSVERYYRVRTPSGNDGWVYGPNIRLNAPTGAVPELPECDDDSTDHSRHAMKTRAASTAAPKALTVGQMLQWVVSTGLPSSARKADSPIANREEVEDVYALTGYVRGVRFQADCDFHVQVASSAAQNASQVIVELPRVHKAGQEQLMALLGFKDQQKSGTLSFPKDPPRLTFVGFAFLDQWIRPKPQPRLATITVPRA